MSWNIRIAHPLSLLADQWIDDWQSHLRNTATLFEPVLVIVPNRNLKRWMQMHVARCGLVAANLRFQYLEEGLRSLLEEIDGNQMRLALLRRTERQSRILKHLHADLARDSNRPEVSGGRQYPLLVGKERRTEKEERLRLYQLSVRLASLFEDYEFHRPRSMEEWRGVLDSASLVGTPGDDALFSEACVATEMAREQRHLYGQIMREFAAGERSDGRSDSVPRLPIAEYARRLITALPEMAPESTTPRSRRPVFLFGLSLLSRMHMAILDGVSSYYDLRFFMLDVHPALFVPSGEAACDEGWESVAMQPRSGEGGMDLLDAGQGGVRNWHRPVEDLARLMGGAGRWFRKSARSDYPLGWLHDRLRGLSSTPAPDDGTLTVAACPGEWREIETVYQSILRRMDEDPSLLLTDIAVLVPDMEHYRPYILHVFDREIGAEGRRLVPYNLSDYSAAEESRYASGVRSILDLVDGPFSRSRVFELFLNPCFLSRRGVDLEMVREWLSLVDDVRIHRFFNVEERAQGGRDHPSSERGDAFTWVRGLRRLYLGLLSGKGAIANLEPHPLLVGDRSSLLKLIETVDDLHSALMEVRRPEGTGRERLDRLLSCTEAFLRAPYDMVEESKVADAFLEAIRSFDPELFRENTYLREAVLASLNGIDGCRGQYLAGGVTICSLQPMRPVPFRHIFIAGLGEGQFPAKEDRSSLDLLWMDRKERGDTPTGDSGIAEKARLLFLETMLSASDSIMLLYRGRDTSRDRELLPCAPLSELISFLDIRSRVQNIPLKLYSAKYLDDSSGAGPNYSAFDLMLASGAPDDVSAASGVNHVMANPLPGRETAFPPADVNVRHLHEFLRHPVEAVLKRRMGLYDSDLRDRSLDDDEPFHPNDRDLYDFRRELDRGILLRIFGGSSESAPPGDIADGKDSAHPARIPDLPEQMEALLESVLADTGRLFAQRDRLPLPPYDDVHLSEWRQEKSLGLFENAVSAMRAYPARIARIGMGMPGAVELPALEMQVDVQGYSQTVRLMGELDFVCIDGPTLFDSQRLAVILLERSNVDLLRLAGGLLPMLLLLSLPDATAHAIDMRLLVPGAGGSAGRTSASRQGMQDYPLRVRATEARLYLQSLVTEYLNSSMEYLPFSLMKDAHVDKAIAEVTDAEIQDRLRSAFLRGESDRMDLMKLVAPQFSERAAQILRGRWGMFMDVHAAASSEAVGGGKKTGAKKKGGRDV